MASAGDLNKSDGDVFFSADVTALLNSQGSIFNDVAQNLFEADYNGFDSRLAGTGVPNLKNVFYSTFKTDTASTKTLFDYDATNDLYKTPSFGAYYVLVEASSFGSWSNSNNTEVLNYDTGKWIVYCTTGTDEVRRAQVLKSLFYGTDGTDQLVLDFTSITTLKTNDSNDVGKQAHYASLVASNATTSAYTGTFANTSSNTNCSSWSKAIAEHTSGSPVTSDELGTDTSGDENDNPANCQLEHVHTGSTTTARWEIPSGSARNSAVDSAGGTEPNSDSTVNAIILCVGDITWATSGDTANTTFANIDFNTTHSIPNFTAAGTPAAEGIGVSTLIFKDTTSSATTNAIPAINFSADASSTVTIQVSADGGSNYVTVGNANIALGLTSGTALWRKITVTRTDLTVEDKVTEQAVKHSLF